MAAITRAPNRLISQTITGASSRMASVSFQSARHHPQHRNKLKNAGDRVVDGLVQHLADAIGVFGEAVGEITGRKLLERPQLNGLQAAEQIRRKSWLTSNAGPARSES